MPLETQKSFFYHIPRTGRCWVRKALEMSGIQYWQNGAQHGWPDPPPDKMTFCFVRHPLTWYGSWWAYHQKNDHIADARRELPSKANRSGWGLHDYLRVLASQCDTFTNFVDVITQRQPGIMGEIFYNYTSVCKRVGQYENITTDLISILNSAGEDFDVRAIEEFASEIVNPAASLPEFQNRCLYTLELIKKTMNSEREIVDKYGYDYIPEGLLK